MSDYLYIGKITNTHGVKGELRILSEFLYKDRAFKIGNILNIDNKDYKIVSYRIHKEYDMVILDSINNIEEASLLKDKLVYIKRLDILNKDEFVILDLIGFNVYQYNKLISKVKLVEIGKKYNYLVLENNKYIPYLEEFINNVDINNKSIYIKDIEGLL